MKRPIALILVGLVTLALAVMAAGAGYERLQTRQTEYLYIADALTPQPEKADLVVWEEARVPLDRPVTSGDEKRVGQALAEAWQAVALSQARGETALLSVRLTGVAQGRAEIAAAQAQEHNTRMVVLSQRAWPLFFHRDGSVFQAEVEMEVARYALSDDGLAHFSVTTDRGIATLMNESNGWRLFSYERRAAEPMETEGSGWSGEIRGVNYYPAKTPWRAFWPGFDVDVIAKDFAQIAGMGANSVRVFLPRDVFVAPEGAGENLRHLSMLLDLARLHGLSVVPTLFDMRGGYGAQTWAEDVLYLERVLPVLNASGAVSFVDLKNEADLDFALHGAGEVEAWLRSITAVARRIAPDLALTVGWAKAESAAIMADQFDLVSYHDYAPVEGARERLAAVQVQVGDKPVVITEIGVSSYNAVFGFPGSERGQAKMLEARLAALSEAQGVMLWTLHDFPNVDVQAVGAKPWVRRQQSAFGLIREDGTEKPAAEVVRKAFGAFSRG
ncbi:hypothetical protein [Celeribacter persicus]|uniref:Cellulase (Glycosyl hydrolase family 5) n=1 Tax=Celeribacter persicus TaxID=1651082 RepID=A0A2T5H9V0_9RHOB|nr:hypothetical protein [Celeribacter persicus]PTQ68355.1 hypothetical protein C8N42_11567 [Celeribacter persicus]